jgi:hypothetical protein
VMFKDSFIQMLASVLLLNIMACMILFWSFTRGLLKKMGPRL